MSIIDTPVEQAVIIYFNYGQDRLDALHDLSRRLDKHINHEGLGEFDGHTIAEDSKDGSLFMYGPSAESLFISVKPIIEKAPFMMGAKAKLRFGPSEKGVKEIIIPV